MAQELLYSANIIATLQEVSGKTVPQSMTTSWRSDTRSLDGHLDRFLQH